jgi:hypothetical protein
MVMVAHQAVGVAAPAKAQNHFAQDIQESLAILVVLKDRFLAVTARGDVVKSAGVLDS